MGSSKSSQKHAAADDGYDPQPPRPRGRGGRSAVNKQRQQQDAGETVQKIIRTQDLLSKRKAQQEKEIEKDRNAAKAHMQKGNRAGERRRRGRGLSERNTHTYTNPSAACSNHTLCWALAHSPNLCVYVCVCVCSAFVRVPLPLPCRQE